MALGQQGRPLWMCVLPQIAVRVRYINAPYGQLPELSKGASIFKSGELVSNLRGLAVLCHM